MKIAILIHGCHLQAKKWANISWGNPKKNILGRTSKAFKVFLENHFDIDFVYWGTGASQKDGVVESQYTFNFTLKKLRNKNMMVDQDLVDLFEKISFIDNESQNTPQEVARCMKLCKERGVKKLILVSSPTHIARCLQSAEVVRSKGGFAGLQIVATASDTCFSDSTPADVLILEPSHRGDRAGIPLHKTLKLAMFARKLPEDQAQEFNSDLVAFLEEQKKKYLG